MNTPSTTAAAPQAPVTTYTIEQVDRILRTRRFVDHSMIGMQITEGLRIVGQGHPTKDSTKVVYNTNAMRKDAVIQAKAFLRDAKLAASIGDNEALQSSLQSALNVGVITFSLKAEWTQFSANAVIHASLQAFTIKDGPDAGKTGVGLSSIRLAPSVGLKADADIWADDEVAPSSVPSAELTEASQLA